MVTLVLERLTRPQSALCRNSILTFTVWSPAGIMLARGKMASVHGAPKLTTGRWSLGPLSETWHWLRWPYPP